MRVSLRSHNAEAGVEAARCRRVEAEESTSFKVNVFTGPVLDDAHQRYRQVELPRQFSNVLTIVRSDRSLSATVYLLSHEKLVEHPGDVADEFNCGAYRMYQVPVSRIEELTKLSLGRYRQPTRSAGRASRLPARANRASRADYAMTSTAFDAALVPGEVGDTRSGSRRY